MQLFKYYFYTIPLPPLLSITIAFIIGIITQVPHSALLLIAGILLIYMALRQKDVLRHNLPLLIAMCALGSFLLQKNIRDHEKVCSFIGKSLITLRGTVINKNNVNQKWTVLEIAIHEIEKDHTIMTCNKSALLYSDDDTDVCVGDYCIFPNLKCSAAHTQDFTRYLIKEQVDIIAFAKTFNYTLEHRPNWSLRRYVYTHKMRLLDSLKLKLSPPTFLFFTSLFLGNRACIKELLEDTNEQFKTWGISHFLARSGLHLALFIFIWHLIFSCIPLSFGVKQFILTLLSILYFILTWTSAPFTRSFALFMINKLFLCLRIPFNLLHALTCVCLCFLLYCPLYLFFLDFQLSFALTFALAWFNQLSSIKNESKY